MLNYEETDGNKKEWVSPAIIEEDFTNTKSGIGDFEDGNGRGNLQDDGPTIS
jgi:hypothetical protein